MGGLIRRRRDRSANRGGGGGQLWCDHCPGCSASDQVALANQQLIGRVHGATGQVQLRREGAHSRYPVSRAQATVSDRLTKTLIKLAINRR